MNCASCAGAPTAASKCPLVIRVAIGGYLTGGAVYHSQSGESIFTHCPGLRVVMPSTALDVAGLLRTAIRCDDPVMFLEHKHLVSPAVQPLRISRAGLHHSVWQSARRQRGHATSASSLTALLFTAPKWPPRSSSAKEFPSEIIDLRSLSPYDWEAIAATVCKNASRDRGLRRHAQLGLWRGDRRAHRRRAVRRTRAPVRRIAAMDTFCAYQPKLEDEILPQSNTVVEAVKKLLDY